MKRDHASLISCCTVLLLLCGAAARAQTLDHLQCYKTRDPAHVDAEVDLDSERFGAARGCKVARAALVCVPASSAVIGAPPLGDAPGQPLEDARVCYKVRCPSAAAPSIELADRFGTRVFTGLETSLVCTPAAEEPTSADTLEPATGTDASSAVFQNVGTYGIPVAGYPHYLERAALVYVNAVRMAPLEYRAKDAKDTRFSMTAVNALGGYPAVEPLRWALGLNRSARFHSRDMLTKGCFQHSSCNGTSWVARVTSFYAAGAGGENIAAGMADPRALVNAWLCDSTGKACCKDHQSCDGHRRNIMNTRFRASGFGYGTNGTRHYWTQDLAGAVVPAAPATPLVDGAHVLIGTTATKFLANYRDPAGAARSVTLVLGGARIAMTRDLGTAARGTFAASSGRAAVCRSYHFEAVDSAGRTWRYPAAGEFRTYGEGTCTRNYVG
jgi:hypothetical protein